MNREFLLLAHLYDPAKHHVAGWYMSSKLDGVRAFWDGGLSIGKWADEVPFANTAKDARLVNRPRATGLWSRYGKVIYCPQWWADRLPKIPLDGELYQGLQTFQSLVSTVKHHEPRDADWEKVKFMIFDSPSLSLVLQDGRINNPNFKKTFIGLSSEHQETVYNFEQTLARLNRAVTSYGTIELHDQEQLPFTTAAAEDRISERLDQVTRDGGEGLMLRKLTSIWEPKRSNNLLKVKKMLDAEGTVIGYTAGRETDRGSKLLGMMGSLRIQFGAVTFDLSGFTDEERRMFRGIGTSAYSDLAMIPGSRVTDPEITNPKFPIGSKVTFKYRELTKDNIPKEARYWRRS